MSSRLADVVDAFALARYACLSLGVLHVVTYSPKSKISASVDIAIRPHPYRQVANSSCALAGYGVRRV